MKLNENEKFRCPIKTNRKNGLNNIYIINDTNDTNETWGKMTHYECRSKALNGCECLRMLKAFAFPAFERHS